MSQVLVIKAHPHIQTKSFSLTVGNYFIDQYKKYHPQDKIIIKNLFEEKIPPLNDITMEAWRKQKFDIPMNNEEKELLEMHEKWLQEFLDSDKYVFINPMYNFFVPAELKKYLDLTAVSHRTFVYTKNGPVGLLGDKNKKVLHIQASGSPYHTLHVTPRPKFSKDMGDEYITLIMNLYGITDIQGIFIEGLDKYEDKRSEILDEALAKADKVAQTF